jgi:phosphatidylserine decarboxylase
VGTGISFPHYSRDWYVTLRLTAGMDHRFHAPPDLHMTQVRCISGDTWNANPVAASFAKGEEMGWFVHGSTIIVVAPASWSPDAELVTGQRISMGAPLLRRA